ncbi:zf-HC2 domain-containing protein [Dechloromonas sp. HYN0024]|nr:zf-HC2 domain-containing protein [Dechloromonas sp. HYN0024]
MSCKEATRLASLQMERKLSWLERLQFRLHLVICVGCRRTEKQFAFMRQAMGTWMNQTD